MSSPRLSVILGSRVFRAALLSSTVVAMVLIGLLWAVSTLLVWQIESAARARLTEAAAAVATKEQQAGTLGLIDIFAPDGGPIRPVRELLIAQSEDELIGVLRGPSYEPIAGFSGLYAEQGWSVAELDYPQSFRPVLAYRFEIGKEQQAILGVFLPERIADIWGFASSATLALGAAAVPIGLITGLVLGRFVSRRLDTLAETVEGVAAGRIETRVPLSGSADEFERLSVNVNAMLDRLEVLNRNIEQVSVGVAHDLKTPLGNIGGRLQLMTRDIENPDAVARHIDAAETHIRTLLRTFDALLRLGEVEAGSRRECFARVCLSTLLADLADSFAPIFTDADKTLTIRVQPGIVVLGDAALLTQMATNVLENCIEHSRDGAETWITLAVNDGVPVLEIGDDGPGIPEHHRERLFERFYRIDPSRSAPGNGLGLSLVKAIVDLHGADVDIDPTSPGMVLIIKFDRQDKDYNSV